MEGQQGIFAEVAEEIGENFPDLPPKIWSRGVEFRLDSVELDILNRRVAIIYADDRGREAKKVFHTFSWDEAEALSRLARILAKKEGVAVDLMPLGWAVFRS